MSKKFTYIRFGGRKKDDDVEEKRITSVSRKLKEKFNTDTLLSYLVSLFFIILLYDFIRPPIYALATYIMTGVWTITAEQFLVSILAMIIVLVINITTHFLLKSLSKKAR